MEEGEMNFHGMKRKQLQALCKKHGILANKSNAEMADLLTLTLKANENAIMQGHDELPDESDSMKVPKKSKNVKFSPDFEVREYEPSVYKGRKRRSMANSGEVNGAPPRARSRMRRTVERNVEEVLLPVVGKKRGRGGEKKGSVGVENVDVTVFTKDGGPQLVKGEDKLSRRQLRSRQVVIEENVEGVEGDLVASRKNSKRGVSRKRGNSEGNNGSSLLDEVSVENVRGKDDAKPANAPLRPRRNARKKETTTLLTVELGKNEIVGRTTRSRAKIKENTSSVTKNKVETFEVQDECQKVLQTEEPLKGVDRYALRRKSFVPQKGVAEEILTEEGVESRKGDGRSRRNVRKKESTSLLSGDFGKTEIVGRTTRSRCSKLEENTSSVITNKVETIEIQGEREKVLQLEEPLKDLGRYALRRKSIVPQKGVAVESVSEEGLEFVKDVRPSKRNMVKATDSKPIIEVLSRRTRFGAQVAGNTCAVESADEVTKVNKEHNGAVQLEESMKAQGRNVSRQKSVTAQKGKVESEGPEVNRETRKRSRNSDLMAVNKVEASVQSRGETEKAPVPTGHLRRSRRNTFVSSSTFAADELGIGEAAGKVVQLKQKRKPMLGEDASAVAGECLVDTPSRQSAQQASKSDLVRSTVPGKIIEKKQQCISALTVMVEEAMFTEETQIEHTRLIMSEATGDKDNFSLDCCKEVFETSDKKASESRPSEMRRTSFLEVSADFQEGVDTETNLQETSFPTSTSLTSLYASSNQEIPENASQLAVINKEANIVVGDMEKLVADVIPDVGVDDPTCRSTEGGGDFVNGNSDELGPAELQKNASNMLSLASGFSSANQSHFAGLEKGLERKEVGEGIHLESGDVNDGSTEIDRISALDKGVSDLEKAGLNVTTKKIEHEEAPCDDRASPAAGEEMVTLSTEINLQGDGDVLLTQAAEEKQNFISEKNSGDVSQVSRGTCTDELLDGEGNCLSAPEEGTNGSENCSAATVPLRSKVSGIGKQRFFSAGDSSVGRNIRHHASDEKVCEDEKHVLDLENKEAAADALPQSSLKELQDKEDNFAITTDKCIAEITGETEGTIHSDSGKASTGVNCLPMLSEELSGYKEMIDKRNCRLDATIDVPISKFHEAVMDMDSGRNMDGESDIEKCETKEEESGYASETEHGDNSGCQKESEKVNANADSAFTHIISEGREDSEGKTVDMMMGRFNDFHTSSKATVSGKIMPRDHCDHVVGKETAKGTLLFELCDHRSSEEVTANLNGSADASLTPTIYKENEISGGKNVGWGGNTSKSIKRINRWTDQETISVGSDSNTGTASADCKDSDDTSDGVMDAELELGVEAGKFDNLKEGNALELERSASTAIENRISMDAIAAVVMENVEKVEDDSKLKHSNIVDEKEYSIVSHPQVTPKGMTEHSVEEGLLHESNEDCDVVPNDSSNNIEVEAEEAGSVAIGGKICFEKVEDCNKWIERTPISLQILERSRKKAKQTSLEQKLLPELYSGTCRMGSSTDAVSELNVLLSDAGEKYKSHPGSKSIGNEAGGKAMASGENELLTGSGASALFTDWEVNLIQGNREQDQFLFTDREVNLIQDSDGEALIDNLISNDSEHTAWVEKNVEEVLFPDREVNLSHGSGEQDQVEESDGVASRDNLISNDPLNEHAADDPIRDLKADENSYPDIQDTRETGLRTVDNVGTAAAETMDILEEVGIRGTSQPVIQAEASHETAKGTLQKTFLSCSELEESTSSEQLVSDDASRGLTEIISVGSVVQQNGPPVYESGFVQELYCKDTSSHGGEETSCDHRGSNPLEQGEFRQEDYEGLIAQTVGAEEAREALNDAKDDTSLETNPSDPQEVAMEEANENPDAVNEPALVVGLDSVTQNQQSRQSERESHTIETEAAHCLRKLDDGVFSKEIVDFGNGLVTSSPFNCQRDVDSPTGSSVSASQHHITENDAWELNLFFGENKQYENQTSDAWFLHTNLRNEVDRKAEKNIVGNGTEQAAIQVAEEQHGELGQVMDEQIEVAKHTFSAVSNESNFEDAEASEKQDCVSLEVDSVQDCTNCENHENKSVNTEHSDVSAENEIFIDIAEFNACHNAVLSEERVERDPSYSKQSNNENLYVEDVGMTKDFSVDVSSKTNVSILDQSSEITNSAVGQDLAVGDDETRQLKLPLSQKTTSCGTEEESHSSDAEQLNTSLAKREISKTSVVQATPQKMVTYTDMKENLASNKREQRGHMTAPNTLSKRRALENLRNN